MCSNCAGDYEDPDMTNDEPLIDALGQDLLDAWLKRCWVIYQELKHDGLDIRQAR
jgi:hypothetical protein